MPERIALDVKHFGESGLPSCTIHPPILGLIASICLHVGSLFLFVGSVSPSYAAQLLFKSSFEGSLLLGEPYDCGTSCWQEIKGSDRVTGYSWPPQIWQG